MKIRQIVPLCWQHAKEYEALYMSEAGGSFYALGSLTVRCAACWAEDRNNHAVVNVPLEIELRPIRQVSYE